MVAVLVSVVCSPVTTARTLLRALQRVPALVWLWVLLQVVRGAHPTVSGRYPGPDRRSYRTCQRLRSLCRIWGSTCLLVDSSASPGVWGSRRSPTGLGRHIRLVRAPLRRCTRTWPPANSARLVCLARVHGSCVLGWRRESRSIPWAGNRGRRR